MTYPFETGKNADVHYSGSPEPLGDIESTHRTTLQVSFKKKKSSLFQKKKKDAHDSHQVPIYLFPPVLGCSGTSSLATPGGSVCKALGWLAVDHLQGCCRTWQWSPSRPLWVGKVSWQALMQRHSHPSPPILSTFLGRERVMYMSPMIWTNSDFSLNSPLRKY